MFILWTADDDLKTWRTTLLIQKKVACKVTINNRCYSTVMLFRDKRIFCFQIITKVWGIRNKYSEESYPMHLIWIIWESESWVRILLWCMDCWWLCLCLEWAECLLTSDWSHSDHAHHSPESAAVVSGRSQSRSQSTGVKQRQLSKDQSLVQTNFDNYQWFFNFCVRNVLLCQLS